MKVNVIRDGNGKVVATFEKSVAGGPQLRPQLKAGHTVHEVDATDSYKKNITEFYKQHSR